MKVAVVLTGHLRCWEQVFPNFKEKVIDRYKPDIFIHTWKDEAYWNPHSSAGVVENAPVVNMDDVIKAYNPRILCVEDFNEFKQNFEARASTYTNFYHVPKNIISMFYKLGQGVLLLEDFVMKTGMQYDLVIRMRPDLVFNENLPEFNTNKLYTLGYRNHMGKGTSDMIQVGNMFSVSLFSKISCYLPAIYNEMGLLCPHEMSEYFIKRLGLPWEEFMINKTIMHTPKGEYVPKEAYMS